MEEHFDRSAMGACLIAGGHRAEHYEVAAYGSLIAWARAMGHDQAADLLEENLEEEKAADKKLTSLAEGGINQEAANAAHPEGDEDVCLALEVGAARQVRESRQRRWIAARGGSPHGRDESR